MPVLLAVYEAIEQGRFAPSSRLHVRNRFLGAVDGRPFRVAQGSDANAEVHAALGRMLTVHALAGHMIVTSSNLATNLLLIWSEPRPRAHRWRACTWAASTCSTSDIDADVWHTQRHGVLSLRAVAAHTFHHFRRAIRRVCDPFTFRLIGAVMGGRSPSLLDLEDRPQAYEDIAHLDEWERQ